MQDKHIIEERIDTFEQLLKEDEFVHKQRTLGEREGFSRGKEEIIEGKVQSAQRILVDIVSGRYPDLREMAQQKAGRTKNIEVLRVVIRLLSVAPSEELVRVILTSPPAA